MNRTHRTLVPLVLSVVLAACAATESPQPAASQLASAPMSSSSTESAEPSATAAASDEAPSPSASVSADALLATTLTDVRSDETFTLGELAADGPILLEPMAVWCTNCRAQQHEVKRAHEAGDFQSVSLDVDLSETPDALAEYADREGFDWRFAMADASLYRLLQERFGVAATNPPSTPLIVIEPDGTVRPLEFGRGTRSAEQLLTEIGAG
jgi:hypothetical protein